MTGPTPGNWSWNMLEDGSATLYATHNGDCVVVADFWRKTLRREPQDTRFDRDLRAEQIANLDLCAAAKDMLAALQLVMQHGRIDDSEQRMNVVAAAIAKATGKSA